MSILEKINNLLTAANTATDAGDEDLTSAVSTLIAGYNPGGSGTPADDLSDIIGAVTGSTDRAKIAALIAAANETTESTDDTLKKAFDSLTAGYGQGGGADVTITYTAASWMLNGNFSGVDTLTLINSDVTTSTTCRYITGVPTIKINNPARTSANRLFGTDTSDHTLEKVVLLSDTSAYTSWQGAFQNRGGLKIIEGVVDCTGATNMADIFAGCMALEDVQFAPDTIGVYFKPFGTSNILAAHLSDASWVSMANALKADAAETLTLVGFGASTFTNIIGKVSGGQFEIDPTGTINLRDFITNVKGWTLTA